MHRFKDLHEFQAEQREADMKANDQIRKLELNNLKLTMQAETDRKIADEEEKRQKNKGFFAKLFS